MRKFLMAIALFGLINSNLYASEGMISVKSATRSASPPIDSKKYSPARA